MKVMGSNRVNTANSSTDKSRENLTCRRRLMKKSLHGICCSHGQGEAKSLVKTHQGL
uniref:Solute carrier family 66 member 1 like n=1 Tax=Gorilla gorilla gorilla TaxID=9595 RepID=A0A2I2YJH5_GORGO